MTASLGEGELDLVIVGGLGRVGLPLGMVFADAGIKVCLYDTDAERIASVGRGEMPFLERGADELLAKVIADGSLSLSSSPEPIGRSPRLLVSVGTPIDEYLNPITQAFFEVFAELGDYLDEEQVIIVRSTVYPGTCEQLAELLGGSDGRRHVAYCPERIREGWALEELRTLPQIVSGTTERALEDASRLFARIAPKLIVLELREAELAKLFTNSWRYLQFAMSNQFYMLARKHEVDFEAVRRAMTDDYERAHEIPSAGFAAGPCLLKDTMQLAAFSNNSFMLGHAAMLVNEGLPNFVVEELAARHRLDGATVGILGMAFKADIDDVRDSLSFKLRKILAFRGAEVLCSDEYVDDPDFIGKEELLERCRIVIVGVPHSAYRELQVPAGTAVLDLWNVLARPD